MELDEVCNQEDDVDGLIVGQVKKLSGPKLKNARFSALVKSPLKTPAERAEIAAFVEEHVRLTNENVNFTEPGAIFNIAKFDPVTGMVCNRFEIN